jgi:hypothetical protein
MLKRASVIVVGRVSDDRLLVVKVIKGKVESKTLDVRFARTFPAVRFAETDTEPNQFLLTGWNERGHVSQERKGLSLLEDRVWLLEDSEDGLVAKSYSSVQPVRYAPLIELFVRRAGAKEIGKLAEEKYAGRIPKMAVEYFHNSDDPGAGALVWQAMRQGGVAEHAIFRTINSLGRDQALRYCRQGLREESRSIRLYALQGLMKYADAESVPQIVELLETGATEYPAKLVEALGVIGDPRAVPVLLKMMNSEDPTEPPRTYLWEHARVALHGVTHVWLSPNGGMAEAWWSRNRNRPASHWIKQGIEQALHVFERCQRGSFVAEYTPGDYIVRETCRWFEPPNTLKGAARQARLARMWRAWWAKNKNLPQMRWVLDSFRDAGRPIENLRGRKLLDALIGVLEADPQRDHKKGPGYVHHYWADRLLRHVTGLRVANPEYARYTGAYGCGKVFAQQWRRALAKHKNQLRLRPLKVPKEDKFLLEPADRELLLGDFDTWEVKVACRRPLIRTELPTLAGKHILAKVEIEMTNRAKEAIIVCTRPRLSGLNGYRYGSGGSLVTSSFECVSHAGEFATVKPGEFIRWAANERLHCWGDDKNTWLMYRLIFQCGGEGLKAWRGVVRTPWLSIGRRDIVDGQPPPEVVEP